MNIPELIIEHLRQGNVVELPGMGTLKGVLREPFHDPESSTYYPASRTVALVDEQKGDLSLVPLIAARECVSEGVARQMWRNYTDALEDKLRKAGSHTFADLGTIALADGKYSFAADEKLNLNEGSVNNMPLKGVKIYTHSDEADPFAQFDDTAADTAAALESERKRAAAAAAAAATAQAAQAAEAEKQRLAAEAAAAAAEAEKQRIAAEAERQRVAAEIEAERRKLEEARQQLEAERQRLEAEKQRVAAEVEAEKQRLAAEAAAEAERQRVAAEEAARAEAERAAAEEAARAEAERVAAEEAARAEAERVAAEEAARAEAERAAAEEAARAEAERAAAEEAARAAAAEEAARKAAATAVNRLAELESMSTNNKTDVETDREREEKNKKDKKKKKRNRLLLILLLVLLLLLLAGGAYCYFSGMFGSKAGVTPSVSNGWGHLDVPAENMLTYNTDLIEYTDRERMMTSDLVCHNMSDYINEFLGKRGYTSARAAMMERVRQYSGQRISELMGDRFAVQRLIPYDDYLYRYNEPYLKYLHANRSRVTVQSELMGYGLLDDILNRMIGELGLQPDANIPKTAAEVQEVKDAERREIETRRQAITAEQQETAPVNVSMARDSKQGFDIIAGCYLTRSTAINLTARLHSLGCDAYIIEKNDMYYVSMGSAASRTSAEALFKHIKSWYDGDIVIKEW